MQPIIKIENLSKMYRLGAIGTGTLSHDLKRWWTVNIRGKEDPYLKIGEINDRRTKGTSQYIWALKDFNLEVMPGEVLGIIGRNGAGKSTLLKILSKVTGPTTGTIHYNGRIGSLLEVGTGFHGEMTGRENIFLNGAMLGMTKSEIKSKLDEIINFSGCERYIDTPVKRYSSGMMVRLGFAVAAHLEPEILVVDEVLAVGDAEFQKKAIGKMQDVSQNDGRTVLFVSHNMVSMKTLCPNGIFLENGQIKYQGTMEKTISTYLNLEEAAKINGLIPEFTVRYNTGLARFTIVKLMNEEGIHTSQVYYRESITLYLEILVTKEIPDAIIDVKFVSKEGIIFSQSMNTDRDGIPFHLNKGTAKYEVKIQNILQPGFYTMNIGLHYSRGLSIDYLEQICEFEVLSVGKKNDYKYKWTHGYVNLSSSWKKLN